MTPTRIREALRGLVVAVGVFALGCTEADDPESTSHRLALTTEAQVLAELSRGLTNTADVKPDRVFHGKRARFVGRAKEPSSYELDPPTGPSGHSPETMNRDELAQALRLVFVDSGDVYLAVEPDYALADKLIELRERMPDLVRERQQQRAQGPEAEDRSVPVDLVGAATHKTIFSPEERTSVTNPQVMPYKRAAFFGLPGTCTGLMIGSHTGLTAAHCVWSRSQGWYVHYNKAWNPGNDYGDAGPWSQQEEDGDFTPAITSGWIHYGGVEWDMAVMSFDDDVGNDTGWFGVDADPDLTDSYIYNLGYPGSPPGGAGWGTQFISAKWEDGSFSGVQLASTAVKFKHDSTEGHSGGPLYQLTGGDRYAIGVVTNNAGPGQDYNWGCRITTDWLGIIEDASSWEPDAWWGSDPSSF